MAGLLPLSQSTLTKLGQSASLACMFEYDQSDVLTTSGIAFQYFPETITDTKAVNYQTKDIPGGSLPLYQWISSGERIISFTAYFSSDVDLGAPTSIGIPGLGGTSGPSQAFQNLSSQGLANRNVDVRTALFALRRFMFPTYLSSGTVPGQPLTQSPQKLMLVFTGTGLGMLGGFGATPGNPTQTAITPTSLSPTQADLDGITVVMTQCDITIEALFPSGLIRVASVQLSFAHIAQLAGIVTFPSYGPLAAQQSLVKSGAPPQLAPYPIQVSWTNTSGASTG
jgi:hypothetical protein